MIWMVEFIGSLEPVWIPHHSIQHSWIFNEKQCQNGLIFIFGHPIPIDPQHFTHWNRQNLGYPTILKPDFWQPCSPPHFHRHWSPFCMGPRMEFHRRLSGYTSDSGDCQLRGWINWINWLSTWKPLEPTMAFPPQYPKSKWCFWSMSILFNPIAGQPNPPNWASVKQLSPMMEQFTTGSPT